MRGSLVLITCFGAVSIGAPAAPHSTPDQLSVDQSAIMQVVLDDAHSKWRERQFPCLADALESATSSNATRHQISRSTRVRSPFRVCRSGAIAEHHLALHEAIIEGRDALISLDYDCPLCGHGTDYSLRKVDGAWRIISRKPGWVS